MDAAVGGLAFYVGILAICGNFLLGLARAIGELICGVGAGISIADIAANSGLTTAAIWTAVAALGTFLGVDRGRRTLLIGSAGASPWHWRSGGPGARRRLRVRADR